MPQYDAIIVGAGPNGLAAAITLAKAGRSVLVLEANDTLGGGARSMDLTLPGYIHDVGSAVHPFGVASPFLRSLPLAEHGLEWVHPPVPLAHPFDDGTAVVLERSLAATSMALGSDGAAYRLLLGPIVQHWDGIASSILGPLRPPRHPLALAQFGVRALWPATVLGRTLFRETPAPALLAGLSAHACMPLEQAPTAAVGLVLAALGHVVGWPFPRGGAGRITDAMASYLRSLGGTIITGTRVRSLDDLPTARAVLCDVTPRQLLVLADTRLPAAYKRALRRYQYGPGVFKVDWALDGPIPWTAPLCATAGTLHLGGTLAEIAASERAPWRNEHSERPYVLLAQPSLFDGSRAPAGKHTAWAYCHVPRGSTTDMTATIEAQVERFAPGFTDRILARAAMGPAALEAGNANLIGGDITGGIASLRQLFTRPTLSLSPYATPAPGLFICSSSTPPGAGVHGMCGFNAAQAALRTTLR